MTIAISDSKYQNVMQSQEAEIQHSERALQYLGIAQELCTKAVGSRGTRQAYFIGRLMAKEHLVSGDPATAHKLLMLVAGEYSIRHFSSGTNTHARSSPTHLQQHQRLSNLYSI